MTTPSPSTPFDSSEVLTVGGQVLSENCPSRRLLGDITSKWGVLVLVALSEGPRRWSELLRGIGGISEKMLAQTLRTLEADRLVLRDARPVVPPFVVYSLTDSGEQVTQLLLPLLDWAQTHAIAEVSASADTASTR
ncbi:HxlR family transcriptional regulator [Nocardiopsis sp. Huas11]|uniref:winged helix-turn-helix transcriptional regulator n=1 Tax=Nocardiopsis sp. Huas11 TaxID=2183912 RepID=UPI000EB21169|nr:helix-turn-helix domain-containing protein [Nocardiopsis sp. Huas11]RKS09195.1 HxlR family transcriptional regulator [Nocardiopsis sp. Huas11]